MRCVTCLECDEPFEAHPTLAKHAEFCSVVCRKTWNNRRATRGAVLYDLMMTLRYERALAQKLRVWRQMCRLAMHWRQEDHAQRASRKSWRPARAVLVERPWLNAVVIANATWRRAA